MSLSTQDIDQLISLIEVAEGETGEDYEVKYKLLKMFPKVKKVRDARSSEWDAEVEKQAEARKGVAVMVFSNLQKDQPILPQLRSTMTKQFYNSVVRENYSDEVCLAADLFKYHLNDLKELGLLKELREWLKLEGEKKGNGWMRNDYKLTGDEDLWHTLTKNFKEALRDE